MPDRTQTPCIGVCSTVFGDTVCRGCKRYNHEVIQWNGYIDNDKAAIIDRLEQLLEQVMRYRIIAIKEDKLAHIMQQQAIRYNANRSPYTWAFDLLRADIYETAALEMTGIVLLPRFKSLSSSQLYSAINEDFIALSEAHYDAHFQKGTSEQELKPLTTG